MIELIITVAFLLVVVIVTVIVWEFFDKTGQVGEPTKHREN